MTTTEIIMAVLAAASLLLAALSWRRTGRKDSDEEAALNAKTRNDLNYLVRGVDEIKADVRAMRGDIGSHERRLTIVEESSKNLQQRFNEHIRMHSTEQ